ncbi:MAG: hypothetical protein ACHQ52_15205 [Candidatus Eisenbacteria bacterium]
MSDLRIPIAAALALSMVAGCVRGTMPTNPDDVSRTPSAVSVRAAFPDRPHTTDPGHDRMPIALGDEWIYDRVYHVYSVSPSGDRTSMFAYHSQMTDFMVCADSLPSGAYAFRRSTEVPINPPGATTYTWVGNRQDRRGLYEPDVSIMDPPACDQPPPARITTSPAELGARMADAAIARLPAGLDAAARIRVGNEIRRLSARAAAFEAAMGPHGGVRPGEIQRLAYPLNVGRSWYVRNQPPDLVLTSEVLAHETCEVPAGRWPTARIGLVWVGSFGPNDVAELWYGKTGLLRFRYHFEGAPDPVAGTTVIENDQRLTHVSLSDDDGRIAVSPR